MWTTSPIERTSGTAKEPPPSPVTAQPSDGAARQALVPGVSGLSLQANPAGQASASSTKQSWLQCASAVSWAQKALAQSVLSVQVAPSAPGLGSGYRQAPSSQRRGAAQPVAPPHAGEQ
jgi:hypothetical protein